MTTVLLAVGTTWILACGLLFVLQRRLVFPAPPPVTHPVVEGCELIEIQGPPAGPVSVLFAPPPMDDGRVVVAFHGNGEQLAWQGGLASAVLGGGFGFLALEYPGYGPMHDQSPSEGAILDAARAALDWLDVQHGIGSERVVLFGRSLGSGPATAMAAEGRGARLLLISPYTSLVDVARRVAPFAPVSLLVRDRFDNAAKAPEIELPTLVVHGAEDDVVPFELGERLSRAFPRCTFLPLEGTGHNDIRIHAGSALMGDLLAFLGASE